MVAPRLCRDRACPDLTPRAAPTKALFDALAANPNLRMLNVKESALEIEGWRALASSDSPRKTYERQNPLHDGGPGWPARPEPWAPLR